MSVLRRYLPILTWASEYSRQTLTNDPIVACIIMLIPQSLAYALLAGLPAQVGLFIEDYVNAAAAGNPAVRHVILECPAVRLTHYDAVASISPDLAVRTLRAEGVRRAM